MVVKIDEDKNGIFETIIATGKESEIKPYSQGFNFTNLWLYIILGDFYNSNWNIYFFHHFAY